MARLNLLFPDAYLTQLQNQAIKKGISLARYARDLIDMGLRVEEAALQYKESQAAKEPGASAPDDK